MESDDDIERALDAEKAKRAKLTRESYARDLVEYRRQPFVMGVRIRCGVNPCYRAFKLSGSYQLDAAPPNMPHRGCDAEDGCTCWWVMITDEDPPPDRWRKFLI